MRRLLLIGFVFLTLFSSRPAAAETRVYVQNNTPFAFTLDVARPGGLALPGQYWKKGASVANPGQRTWIYETNRDEGVKNGKYFEFHPRLTFDGKTFILKQRLKGTTFFSHLWQSVQGQPWYDDRATHRAEWNAGKYNFTILYRAYFTGGADDIEYIIQYRYPKADVYEHGLNVLAFNTYMRPTGLFINGQSDRARFIPAQIKNQGYEVIIFSELFDNSIRKSFLASIRDEWPHQTSVVGSDGLIEQDGGVVIVSKYPIVAQGQRMYGSVSSGLLGDKLADKGVKYACVNKNGLKFHIFGTHTQADKGATERNVRRRQFQIIKEFIASRKIPRTDAVIVGGDLNVDKTGSPAEYQDMISILNAKEPMYLGNLRATWDPTINKCADSGTPEYLDYVFPIKGFREPAVISMNEVRLHRANQEWKSFPTDKSKWDLSDHFPVLGVIMFKKDERTSVIVKPSSDDSGKKRINVPSSGDIRPVRP